jgi:hypothetical protein
MQALSTAAMTGLLNFADAPLPPLDSIREKDVMVLTIAGVW